MGGGNPLLWGLKGRGNERETENKRVAWGGG